MFSSSHRAVLNWCTRHSACLYDLVIDDARERSMQTPPGAIRLLRSRVGTRERLISRKGSPPKTSQSVSSAAGFAPPAPRASSSTDMHHQDIAMNPNWYPGYYL